MNKLSVIIAFLNEGREIENTILEIKNTAGEAVDIVLVNDASTDGFDYLDVSRKYGTFYIENTERKGCAASREIGVNVCITPFIFIIDGHMRFYNNNWWLKIIEAIESDDRAIYCCRCKTWDYNTKTEVNIESGQAAYMNVINESKMSILDIEWIPQGIINQNEEMVDIPCIFGACYAASKRYWKYLRGGEGLKLYSCDEQYISMKAWMEGGKCQLLNKIEVGHLFREKFPYTVNKNEAIYNKIVIMETLLPYDIRKKSINILNKQYNIDYLSINELALNDCNVITELKVYYNSILNCGFNRFLNINNQIKKLAIMRPHKDNI